MLKPPSTVSDATKQLQKFITTRNVILAGRHLGIDEALMKPCHHNSKNRPIAVSVHIDVDRILPKTEMQRMRIVNGAKTLPDTTL